MNDINQELKFGTEELKFEECKSSSQKFDKDINVNTIPKDMSSEMRDPSTIRLIAKEKDSPVFSFTMKKS